MGQTSVSLIATQEESNFLSVPHEYDSNNAFVSFLHFFIWHDRVSRVGYIEQLFSFQHKRALWNALRVVTSFIY